jgi:cell division protein FtsQ
MSGVPRFVLPRFARKPARLFGRLLRGETAIPRHTGAAVFSSFLLATGIYGTVLGGHTPAVMEAMTSVSGLAIDEVRITGNEQTSELDILDTIGLTGMTSLATFDAASARDRIAELPWVSHATVRKTYPNTVRVEINERRGFAVWQHGEQLTVVDKGGKPIDDFVASRDFGLPLVVGPGAQERVSEAVHLVTAFPTISSKVKGYVRVGERRWDLRLQNGVTIKLPEQGAGEALQALVAMERAGGILDRDIVEIDLRLTDRVVIRLGEEALKAREVALKEREVLEKKRAKAART